MLGINNYPFLLGSFNDKVDGNKIFGDYISNFGINNQEPGKYYFTVSLNFFPFTNYVSNGLLNEGNHKNYSLKFSLLNEPGGENLYLFLHHLGTVIHNQPTLPMDYFFGGVDGYGNLPDGTAAVMQNLSSAFDVLSESGAYFEKDKNYRKWALVKCPINGFLYRAKSVVLKNGGFPSIDNVKWELYTTSSKGYELENILSFTVRKNGDDTINGVKTFTKNIVIPTALKNDEAINLLQAKNTFLGINSKASDSSKLNGFGTNGVNSPYKVPVTDSQGFLDNSFFRFKVINFPTTLIVTNDVGVPNSFRTIQSAWDSLANTIITAPVTIKVADGEYYSPSNSQYPIALMQGNVYSWLIRVIGNEQDPTRVKIKLNDNQIAFKTYCDGILINGFSIEGKVTGSNFGIGIQVKDGTNAILGASMIYKDLSTCYFKVEKW
jgi:hypothetical protein